MIILTHLLGYCVFLEVWSYLLVAEKRNNSAKIEKLDPHANAMCFRGNEPRPIQEITMLSIECLRSEQVQIRA